MTWRCVGCGRVLPTGSQIVDVGFCRFACLRCAPAPTQAESEVPAVPSPLRQLSLFGEDAG